MDINFAPIILFVYNRLDHTCQTVKALQKNELAAESILYVFADGAKDNATEEQNKKVQDVRDYIHTITGFKEIIIEEAPKNKGLANSVIAGVTKVINKHGRVIVVEDDIVTHPFFLRFMNDCLDVYEKRDDIFMIGGYTRNIKIPKNYFEDIYIVHRSNSWGWATWVDRWSEADWEVTQFESLKNNSEEITIFNRGGNDMFPMLASQMEGEIDSWAIRWDYNMFLHDAYCIYPVKTFDYNVGMDGSGVHCGSSNRNITASFYDKKNYIINLPVDIKENRVISKHFYEFMSTNGKGYPSFWERVSNSLHYRLGLIKGKIINLYIR